MDPRWRETFAAWALEPAYRAHVAAARQAIQAALAQARQPYVAYSGGRDSTALLHLVLAYAPDIVVYHSDLGAPRVPRPLYQEIVRHARAIGARRLRIEPERTMRSHVGRWRGAGYDLAFVGLRAAESGRRRRRIAAGQQIGGAECWPLAAWTWLDVMAYHLEHGVPYLSVYDQLAPLVGWEHVRWHSLFDPKFHAYGSESVDGVLHWRYRHAPLD